MALDPLLPSVTDMDLQTVATQAGPEFILAVKWLRIGAPDMVRDVLTDFPDETPSLSSPSSLRQGFAGLAHAWICGLVAEDPVEAVRHLRAAVSLLAGLQDYESADLCSDLASALAQGSSETAADRRERRTLLDRAIALDPRHGAARHNRARLAMDGSGPQGRGVLDNAVLDDLHVASVVLPDQADVWADYGAALRWVDRPAEAVGALRRSVILEPDRVDLWDAFGAAALAAEDLTAAQDAFERALDLQPNRVESLANLAAVRIEQRQLADAIHLCEQALDDEPEDPGARVNRAFAHCLQNRYDIGLTDYRYRWRTEEFRNSYAPVAAPEWDGWTALPPQSDLPLLVRCEQGFGDQIMAARFLPWVLEHIGTRSVLVECHPALHRLFARSFDRWPERLTFIPMGPPPPPVCAWIGALDLAAASGIGEGQAIPVPYLRWEEVDPIRPGSKNRPRIGVAWSGKPKPKNRSCPAEMLIPAVQDAGAEVVVLQTGAAAAQARPFLLQESVTDAMADVSDFADTADVMTRLDAVVSVDTAVAHLAGALGVPVHILLVEAPDWRWGAVGEHCLWYPTARLYRRAQRTQRAWAEPLALLTRRLQNTV